MAQDGEPPKGLIDRRSAIGLAALAIAEIPLRAAAETQPLPNTEVLPLWPSVPPGGEGNKLVLETVDASQTPGVLDRKLSSIARPELTVFRPAAPDGSAILIIPGGGYSFEAFDREGVDPAIFFSQRGTTAFVLTYRLPFEGWKNGRNVPLEDAQRAIRIIRSAGLMRYGISPDRVGVLGFSAGGHLAAMLATKFATESYTRVDDADAMDTRPTFAALLYPVITMRPPYAHESSVEKLLGRYASLPLRAAYSVESLVARDTPPCFLCAALDDPDVSIENTQIMFGSLKVSGIANELHIFEKGGHGFGLRAGDLPIAAWPELLWRWCVNREFIRPRKS